MRTTPVWNSMHAAGTPSPNPPPLADYPIPLLTRRTFGEMAGGILAERQHAPQSVSPRAAVHRPRNV